MFASDYIADEHFSVFYFRSGPGRNHWRWWYERRRAEWIDSAPQVRSPWDGYTKRERCIGKLACARQMRKPTSASHAFYECYRTEPFDIKDIEDLIEGRGQRRRNIVRCNDGLSDDAWAMVCFSVVFLFSFLTYTRRLLRMERTSRNFLNKDKTNFSKRMIHHNEEHPHQKWTDGP